MNIAIIIAVSDYKDLTNLPACSKDAELIHDLLKATDKYGENILYVASDTSSASIKEKIVTFVSNYKGKEIREVFFYYSGHGEFTGDDFYYLLSDYKSSQRKQTSIDNSELDDWLRSLNPKLTVKVVDACQAGMPYIKDSQSLTDFLSKTTAAGNSLGRCYFMYSSMKDQSSYQDTNLSFFTSSFAKAVCTFQGTQIRYKDIMDFISDEFQGHTEQTPFFITQATNTEQFCSLSDELKEVVCKHLPDLGQPQSSTNSNASTQGVASLVHLVAKDAEKYCTIEEVKEVFEQLHDLIVKHQFTKDFNDLYDVKFESSVKIPADVPKTASLGKWLSENENDYFAEPYWEEEKFEVEVPVSNRYGIAAGILAMQGDENRTKTVTKTRQVIVGMRITEQGIPFTMLRVKADPKYENLRYYESYITFVFSKTELRGFYYYAPFRELNWNDRKIEVSENWRSVVCPLKSTDAILKSVDVILNGFLDFVMKPLKDKYAAESQVPQMSASEDASASHDGEPEM